MDLKELEERKNELDTSIQQATNNVYVLHGHKAEIEFQISELLKSAKEEVIDVSTDSCIA